MIKKIPNIALAIFLSCIFFHAPSFSQPRQFIFRHFTTENGLANNIVTSLFQDSKGYIWIGTIDGLQRYDGCRFVNYLPDIHDPEALHNGWIFTTFEDSKQRLWIGTASGGAYLLNRVSGKFYNYGLHDPKGVPTINGVIKFVEDSKGDIWLMNSDGYFRLNNTSNQFENYNSLVGITRTNWPLNFAKDNKGNIWFVTKAGIKYYNLVSKKIYDKNNNPGALKILQTPFDITAFFISQNNFWMGIRGRNELVRYDIDKNFLFEYPFDKIGSKNKDSTRLDVKTYNLTGHPDGSLMVDLFNDGIAFYDPVKDSFTKIPLNNEDPEGLHGLVDWGTVSLKDRDGNMWVSGNDKGLNFFNPSKIKFTFYRSNATNAIHVPDYSANSFVQDPVDGDVYVGYYHPNGGIARFSSDLVFKKKYLVSNAGNTNALENQVWWLFQNDDGSIMAPNQLKTIVKLDAKTDKLSIVKDSALFTNINFTKKDQRGDMWLGTWSAGLKKIDHQTKQVSTFLETAPGATDPARNILSACFEGDSIVWVGTNEQGLLRFDTRINKYSSQYLYNENDPLSISSNKIKTVIHYNDDTLLLATTMGVNIFDKKRKTFHNISTKDGLAGNLVETMVLDNNKNLLVACDGGLCKLNMHSFSVTRYGIADGITDNIFINASLKLKDGRFLISTENGFIAFDPDKLTDSPPANPVITGFKVFDKDIKIDSLLDASAPITLSYKNNSIVIEFAALQYNFSDETKYYYQLEAVDHDWILSDKDQSAHYNQLQNGKYVFKVKCVNRDGLASQNMAVLTIIITPPFWKTWWFRSLALLFGVFMIWWFVQQRIRKVKTAEKIKQQITELEIKALKAQMNPHFIFNAMNSIQEFTLMGEVDNANKYISKFSKLLRKVLHQSNQNSILLSDEIETLRLYLEIENVRLGKDFHYDIHADNETEAQVIRIPSMLLQPFVENALHHGLAHKEGNKYLQVNFKMPNEETLICEITDNGIGRAKAGSLKDAQHPSLKHESLGIQLVEERLRLLTDPGEKQTTIHIEDIISGAGEAEGTKVTITIPQL